MMKVRDPLYEAPPPTADEIGGKVRNSNVFYKHKIYCKHIMALVY